MEHGLILASMGCRVAQGYLISRAIPAEDFPDWVKGFRSPSEWARFSGWTWSRGLHELLRARNTHRLWVDALLGKMPASKVSGAPPSLAACPLSEWLQTASLAPELEEEVRKLVRAHEELHTSLAQREGAETQALASLGDAFTSSLDRILDRWPPVATVS